MAIVKAIAAIALLFLFTVFAFQNTQSVAVKFLFWDLTVASALLMLICLAVGCIIGLLLAWEISSRSKKRMA